MKIVCFGDSLTYGSIGYSYCKYIDTSYRIINKGINGDTTYCVHERLKEYLRVRQEADTSGVDVMAADIYVIHVGINDILLPYLATLSPLWKVRTDILVRIRRCIFEDALFKVEYEKILQLLQQNNCPFILVGMPMCQMLDFPNDVVRARNKIIKHLAMQYGVRYIDAYDIQLCSVGTPSVPHSWKGKNSIRIMDDLIMTVLPFSKDWFSNIRRLNLTVDGIHYNSRSARSIGESVGEALQELMAEKLSCEIENFDKEYMEREDIEREGISKES